MILVLDILAQVFHLTFIDSHPQILLGEKPFHKLRKHSTLATVFLQVAGECLGSGKIFLLLHDMGLEFFNFDLLGLA